MEDEDRYTRITLRIPKQLHQRLGDAAARTSKSLNAEIVARLEGSFQEAESAFKAELKSQILASAIRSDNLQMRFELISSRMDNLRVRIALAETELERRTATASTDGELEAVEENINALDAIHADLVALRETAAELRKERDAELARLESLRQAMRAHEESGPEAGTARLQTL